MKKNYIYLSLLLLGTVVLTFGLSLLYQMEMKKSSYAYENLNKIVGAEFDEYMMEHPDAIIYIGDQSNLENNKLEKKLIKKMEKINLSENIVYLDKKELNDSLIKKMEKNYDFKYNEGNLPVMLVIVGGEIIQVSEINSDINIETVIDYEVFE